MILQRAWLTLMAAYEARTFTFQLTPEFMPCSAALAKLIDRKVVLSYKSFLFLKENNFSFEKAFARGVPYLSRAEAGLAKRLYLTHDRTRRLSPIWPRNLDTWSRKFYNDTRVEISSWLETAPEPV